MADRLRRARAGSTSATSRSPRTSAAIIALALILYEGGLSSGWAEIRPVIGVSIALATLGHAAHRGADRARRRRCCSASSSTLEALLLGLDRGRDRRRGRVRRAARLDAAAPARAHARGRVGHQRPDRGPARARLHRGDPARRLRRRRRALAGGRASSRSAPPSGSRSAALGVFVAAARDAAVGRPVPGRLGRARRRWPSAARPRCTAPASSPSSSPGSCVGSASTPARRTIVTFHEGLAWVAQLGAVPAARAARVPARSWSTSRSRARRSRSSPRVVARPLAALHRRPTGFTLPRAADARLGGPARRDPDRVRHLPGHRGHPARAT